MKVDERLFGEVKIRLAMKVHGLAYGDAVQMIHLMECMHAEVDEKRREKRRTRRQSMTKDEFFTLRDRSESGTSQESLI